MISLRRCFPYYLSKARQSSASASFSIDVIARRAEIAVVRNFTASSSLTSGALADVCNIHVVSSPYAPIVDPSTLSPVHEFVSSEWTNPDIADKVAIRDGSTGEIRTFSDYHIRMNRIASALKTEYQLKPNEAVSIFSPNNVDYLPISLAVGLCGAKVVPINPLYTATELSKLLVPSHAKILFAHAKLLPVALEAVLNAPCVEHIIVIPDVQSDAKIPHGSEHLERLTAYEASDKNAQYDAIDVKSHPFLLPYSSGTTGLSKGCMLSHANIVANLLQTDEVERPVFPQHHKLVSPLPFFHIYGLLVSLIYCGWRGQELITMSDRFDLERFCQLVQEHRPERAHLVPPVSDE